MKSFAQFWPFYLGEHRHGHTRGFHSVGTLIGLGCLFMVVPWTRNEFWALFGFGVGYAMAWFSHFAIEHNRPATLKYPLWSFFADVEMLYLVLTGQLHDEIRAHSSSIERPVVTHERRTIRKAIRVIFWAWVAILIVLDLSDVIHLTWPSI